MLQEGRSRQGPAFFRVIQPSPLLLKLQLRHRGSRIDEPPPTDPAWTFSPSNRLSIEEMHPDRELDRVALPGTRPQDSRETPILPPGAGGRIVPAESRIGRGDGPSALTQQ